MTDSHLLSVSSSSTGVGFLQMLGVGRCSLQFLMSAPCSCQCHRFYHQVWVLKEFHCENNNAPLGISKPFLQIYSSFTASLGVRWMIGQTEIDRGSSYGNKEVPLNNNWRLVILISGVFAQLLICKMLAAECCSLRISWSYKCKPALKALCWQCSAASTDPGTVWPSRQLPSGISRFGGRVKHSFIFLEFLEA